MALAEIRRILRPAGRLTIVFVGQESRAFNVLYRFGGMLAPAFWCRQVREAMRELIEPAGFKVSGDLRVRQGFYASRIVLACKTPALH